MSLRMLLVAAIASTALALSACGGYGASRHSYSHGHAAVSHKLLCTYHAWRAVHDVRGGYNGFAAFHVYALRHCIPHRHR